MILTCPSCSVRYVVAEGAVGPKGRRVRCASCGHTWTQAPETGLDDILFGDNIVFPHERDQTAKKDAEKLQAPSAPEAPAENVSAFEALLREQNAAGAIPEGVRPRAEDDPVLAQLGKSGADTKVPRMRGAAVRGLTAGFVAAGIFYLFVIALFLVFQPQISRAWPASNLFYGIMGIKPVLPSEGLALDALKADMQEGRVMLSGDVLNLKSADLDVPRIVASFTDGQGKILAKRTLPPPVTRLKAEGKAAFSAVFEGAESAALKDAANVTFAFDAGGGSED